MKNNYKESDFKQMLNNPRMMRNIWRGRLRISADAVAKERNPVKKKQFEKMYYLQKKRLKEWEDKVK